jgi:hypothetical protein
LEDIQSHFDTWLDETGIDGDSVLVVGDIEQELKYAYTVAFTRTISDIDNQDISKKYTPKFLFGTSGCVGAGLDSDEVRLVIWLGMPTSIINLIQEMGQCGHKKQALSSNEPNKDWLKIYFSLYDFIYLNERIYMLEETNDENDRDQSETASILSKDDELKMQVMDLNRVAQLLSLKMGCWHVYLENQSANPTQV